MCLRGERAVFSFGLLYNGSEVVIQVLVLACVIYALDAGDRSAVPLTSIRTIANLVSCVLFRVVCFWSIK